MGTHWNRLVEAVLTSTHNLCFEQKYEKYQNFLSENFHFLMVKFSVHLNRRVFVMTKLVNREIRGMFEMNCLFLSGDFKSQVSPKVLISCPRSTPRG